MPLSTSYAFVAGRALGWGKPQFPNHAGLKQNQSVHTVCKALCVLMANLLNYHREHSRLDEQRLAQWHGLPVCWGGR